MPELSSSLPIHSLENSKERKTRAYKPTINSIGREMAKKLYVGNLSFQVTEADLSELFAQVGAVDSVKIITDRDTGRSKGFAFVEMSDDSAAAQAISKFNGTDFNGRNLTVNEARPMEKPRFWIGRTFWRPRSWRTRQILVVLPRANIGSFNHDHAHTASGYVKT